MAERIRTIIFYADGEPHWRRAVTGTLVGGLRLKPELFPLRWRQSGRVRSLFREELESLSYYCDWKDAFCAATGLDVTLCKINNLIEYLQGLRRMKDYPLVVILHSAAAGENWALLRMAASSFQARRGRLLVFFSNEFANLSQKIRFAKSVDADFIASQLPLQTAGWLYADCTSSTVLPAPAALNPDLYHPKPGPRPIDIGFRGSLYQAWQVGDTDRTDLLMKFQSQAHALGLVADIAFERYPRSDWSGFLNRCKGIIGAESGTSYLERDDRTQRAVTQYLDRHPEAEFREVYDRFFRGYDRPVSGKAISSRHFEPIGTKTCQVLLEGHYNGILKPDEHYISVKPDFSNLGDAVARFKDDALRQTIVNRTYEYVMGEHTYQRRIEQLLTAMTQTGAFSC